MSEEKQYLDNLKFILENGSKKNNRTGIATYSVNGISMRFSLKDDKLPLITTKKVFFNSVAHELLWFISGDTSIDYLKENKVKIWDQNAEDFYNKKFKKLYDMQEENLSMHIKTNREYYYRMSLDAAEKIENLNKNDLGPVYGYQWRNFNGQKVDQLQKVINSIKNDPESRRHIVSAWNPCQVDEGALPPCHVLYQFIVDGDELSCVLYQRSADMFLGVPFNIASYSLLTHIIAKLTNKKPKEFIHFIADAHIYENHIDQVKEQVSREPYEFPKIQLNIKNDIDEYNFDDFNLIDYKFHPFIKADMAV
jgi:thymidylate synthase